MIDRTALVHVRDGHCLITLNRPETLNAFNVTMNIALHDELEEANLDGDCRAILVKGAGRSFCVETDITRYDFSKGPPGFEATLSNLYKPINQTIRILRKLVIAAVNGVTARAGANLALACDIVIASASAKFIQSFSKFGLALDAAGTWTLPPLIGDASARALVLLAEPTSGEQAELSRLVGTGM
jgi:2-(1,2-epoxy-1,2-dihydrophenyl)acetyl-CoA isomerase